MNRYFPHEKLACYQLALDVSRWFHSARFPRGCADLKSQGSRAASSVALNIAEGSLSIGKNRRRHFRYAIASAAEASAVLDLVQLEGAAAQQVALRRVAAMVRGLRQRPLFRRGVAPPE